MEAPLTPDRTSGGDSEETSSVASPYRRDRFNRRTRREAFQGKIHHAPAHEAAMGHTTLPQRTEELEQTHQRRIIRTSIREQPTFRASETARYTQPQHALHPELYTSSEPITPVANDAATTSSIAMASLNQQQQQQQQHATYYRVVYRGVVALLAEPNAQATRSGTYLGYGEIFLSSDDDEDAFRNHNDTTTNRNDHGDSTFIRVDQVLTGGYAVDGRAIASDAKTPKRSNLEDHHPQNHPNIYAMGTSPQSMTTPDENQNKNNNNQHHGALGFVLGSSATSNDQAIVQAIPHAPTVESGHFLYRVVSSTPLPILTGPSLDAPKIKAMALPGTVHEVSLRLCIRQDTNASSRQNTDNDEDSSIWFLRLSHRRGWVAQERWMRKHKHHSSSKTSNALSIEKISVMKEVAHHDHHGQDHDVASVAFPDDVSAVSSTVSSSVMSIATAGARRRHRIPRKKQLDQRYNKDTSFDKPPRHIGKTIPTNLHTPSKASGANRSYEQGIMTPSSNVSILSDDSSLDRSAEGRRTLGSAPTSPGEYSQLSNTTSSTSHHLYKSGFSNAAQYFLMRVTAPRGLKILDAPHFQVSNLIRGKGPTATQSHLETSSSLGAKSSHSIFPSPTSRMNGQTSNAVIFDANTRSRLLPRGAIFEASKRMESTGAFSQGVGLIKLSDGSGWAVVPRQDELDQQYITYHGTTLSVKEGDNSSAYETVGAAVLESSLSESEVTSPTKWVRVTTRSGVHVTCPPPIPPFPDDETSPSSSRGGSSALGSLLTNQDSDVASSVASTFVDAMMFRTPKKKLGATDTSSIADATPPARSPTSDKHSLSSNLIPCGMCVEVENTSEELHSPEFVRLLGGQGWVPLSIVHKEASIEIPRPDFRFGSFWFRVQSSRGIKVRLGPSKKAPSIKSEDGVYFRFECGEFLRASEIMTTFSSSGEPEECFAKLYRNRHARLHQGHEEYRSLQSLTVQAEWVQVFSNNELFLEECAAEPRIERHQQGWRYSVAQADGIPVRRGPSFASETTSFKLTADETVMINERVRPAGEKITWLRLKDRDGWLYDCDEHGVEVMALRSFGQRARSAVASRPSSGSTAQGEKAYNAIISRLFQQQGDGQSERYARQNASHETR